MTNEKKKTKVNKFLDLKYVLIISGIVLVIFGLFKYFTASNSVDNNKKEEEIKEKITSEVLYTKTEEGLNKVITSNFGDKELSIVCSKIDDSSCELKVNNKFVLNNNIDVVVESIHRVGDSLIILASESSSNSGYLYFINSDGSVNNVIGNRLENSLSFSLNVSSNKFKVEGSKIYFEMSSIRERSKLLVNGNLLVDVLTESEKLSQYNINDESVVEALYEVEYLGNGKFSEIKIIEEYSCEELKDSLGDMNITN